LLSELPAYWINDHKRIYNLLHFTQSDNTLKDYGVR
jgi:hypothetical protein